MIKNIKVFDCTLREVGYQTGWYFDKSFSRALYKFAQGKSIDYVELGFFHNQEADKGRGAFRYCSTCNDEIFEIFAPIRNRVKISSMRDIQRPLSELLPKDKSVIDAVRILTRSHETVDEILVHHIKEVRDLGYEVFVNFTSSGYNSIEQNKQFAQLLLENNVPVIYFADTESVMTTEYVAETIKACHEAGLKVGMHFHNKNGTAEELSDCAIRNQVDYMDVTHLGLGGKWRDGNLTMEYYLSKISANGGFEQTLLKNELIDQLVKYHEHSTAE